MFQGFSQIPLLYVSLLTTFGILIIFGLILLKKYSFNFWKKALGYLLLCLAVIDLIALIYFFELFYEIMKVWLELPILEDV